MTASFSSNDNLLISESKLEVGFFMALTALAAFAALACMAVKEEGLSAAALASAGFPAVMLENVTFCGSAGFACAEKGLTGFAVLSSLSSLTKLLKKEPLSAPPLGAAVVAAAAFPPNIDEKLFLFGSFKLLIIFP